MNLYIIYSSEDSLNNFYYFWYDDKIGGEPPNIITQNEVEAQSILTSAFKSFSFHIASAIWKVVYILKCFRRWLAKFETHRLRHRVRQ